MKKLISIDIGSTYTKGVLFLYFENESIDEVYLETNRINKLYINGIFNSLIIPINRAQVPTTTNHLADGFFEVLSELLSETKINGKFINQNNIEIKGKEEEKNNDIEVFYSSSAKGGLNIVAIGIVPELTLKTAKLTALSAGGKVTKAYSYRLNKKNIKEIDQINPDIILFTGGTDGGNEEINIHNAKMLSSLSIRPVILYAGNQSCSDEIYEILSLSNFDIKVTENVLPEIDKINIEPAKDCIRDIFLKKIIHGKGLDQIVDKIGFYPEPTPLSVFNFISVIPDNVKKIKGLLQKSTIVQNNIKENAYYENITKLLNKNWESFIAIDMGGATTDFYSYHKDKIEDSNVLLRGLSEPTVKRTVEGDLGMRVSAKAVLESGMELLKIISKDNIINIEENDFIDIFSNYIDKIHENPSYIPENDEEQYFDRIIATICIRLSSLRHAGKYKRIFTVNGEKLIQYGKNLRHVKTLIGSGGYLSRMNDMFLKNFLTFSYENFFNKDSYYEVDEEIPLLPESIDYLKDKEYYLPILANVARKYPLESVLCFIENLEVYD